MKAARWIILVAFALMLALAACAEKKGDPGAPGAQGPPGDQGESGVVYGTFDGQVVNALTGKGDHESSISVSPQPDSGTVPSATDAQGKFSMKLPVGSYTLTFSDALCHDASATVALVAGENEPLTVSMEPLDNIVVLAGGDQDAGYGATVNLSAQVVAMDGSNLPANPTVTWSQVSGAEASLATVSNSTVQATLAGQAGYRDNLLAHLNRLDRMMVQPINPHALEEGSAATFKAEFSYGGKVYSDTVSVHVPTLPYAVSTGLGNVPLGVPVLLNGKAGQASYSWTGNGPNGAVTLANAATRNPSFTPGAVGHYTLTESTSGLTLDVYADNWAGGISGIDANGNPEMGWCQSCHYAGSGLGDAGQVVQQFGDWAKSGHAEIFTQNLNTSSYYGTGCLGCHTVGYDPAASNKGFDDAAGYLDFLNHGMMGNPSPTNWSTMLTLYPATAKRANIQCENCHGPGDSLSSPSTLHFNNVLADPERISIASDLCASCHGEPARHARFQQWEESGHGNFALAEDQATVENRAPSGYFAGAGHCGRCHSGQGHMTWVEAGKQSGSLDNYIVANGESWQSGPGADNTAYTAALSAIGLNLDEVQPQTCAVCHDPHAQGDTSGEPNTATVRVEGDTPYLPAGFVATGLGRGAICATCHNTRNGTHDDSVAVDGFDAPHTAAQTDVLLGRNAYFVTTGARAPHSFITDTCANCHMELTDPPAEWSHNLGGTNHAFKASTAICTECHGAYDGGSLQSAVGTDLHALGDALGQVVIADMAAAEGAGDNIVLDDHGTWVDIDTSLIAYAEPHESHGRPGLEFHDAGGALLGFSLLADISVWVDADSDTVVDDGETTALFDPTSAARDEVIAKAAWNYFLLHGDDSLGVHNPGFYYDVINATASELSKL